MRFATQALSAAAVVGVAAAAGSAFTAGNTGTPTVAVGQASTVTSGYAVSGVDYVLAAAGANGDQLASVAFTVTPTDPSASPAGEARVRLVSGGSYSDCGTPTASGSARTFTCALAGVSAAAVNVLDIVALS